MCVCCCVRAEEVQQVDPHHQLDPALKAAKHSCVSTSLKVHPFQKKTSGFKPFDSSARVFHQLLESTSPFKNLWLQIDFNPAHLLLPGSVRRPAVLRGPPRVHVRERGRDCIPRRTHSFFFSAATPPSSPQKTPLFLS